MSNDLETGRPSPGVRTWLLRVHVVLVVGFAAAVLAYEAATAGTSHPTGAAILAGLFWLPLELMGLPWSLVGVLGPFFVEPFASILHVLDPPGVIPGHPVRLARYEAVRLAPAVINLGLHVLLYRWRRRA